MAVALLALFAVQDPAERERDIERTLERLERRMLDLGDRLESSQPEYARRLRDVVTLLTTDQHVRARMRSVIARIAGQPFSAYNDVDTIESILADALKLLEEDAAPARRRRALERIREIRERQERADRSVQEQRRIRELTEEVRPDALEADGPLRRAAERMDNAAHRMIHERWGEAEREQDEAIVELRTAETELRRRAEEETFVSMETLLKACIEEQERVNAATRDDRVADAPDLAARERAIREKLDAAPRPLHPPPLSPPPSPPGAPPPRRETRPRAS